MQPGRKQGAIFPIIAYFGTLEVENTNRCSAIMEKKQRADSVEVTTEQELRTASERQTGNMLRPTERAMFYHTWFAISYIYYILSYLFVQ